MGRAIARGCHTALAALVLIAAPAAQAQEGGLELAVKATYLAKLAPFIDWPADGVQAAGGAFTICIIGADPFGALLDRAVGAQTVGGRPVVVRRLETLVGNSSCAVAYIGAGDLASLAATQDRPVLTVTDQAPDPALKGIVNFVTRDRRVRLEIDDITAARVRLGISSKLLSLAVSVRSRSGAR